MKPGWYFLELFAPFWLCLCATVDSPWSFMCFNPCANTQDKKNAPAGLMAVL